MIKVTVLGKIKEQYLVNAIEDYLHRIKKYYKIEIIELKDDNDILKEEKQILKVIDSKDYNVVMDIAGEQLSSPQMAKMIDQKLMEYGNINFIIGSSNGLSDEVKKKANMLLSFGKITLPHGLFRLVLLEQIYRSFKINNNESYHK